MNIHNLLEKFEINSKIYFESRSINNLRIYLLAYFSALPDYNIKEIFNEYDQFIVSFQRWLARKYSIKTSQNWAQIILFYSFNEQDAFDNFFKLYREYLESEKIKNIGA